ncbi:MAG: hypothetical protein E6471_30485, partial [Bradyrhizobium sp.]|nr:hypothetical protein [Bradyrhizobium sp.]
DRSHRRMGEPLLVTPDVCHHLGWPFASGQLGRIDAADAICLAFGGSSGSNSRMRDRMPFTDGAELNVDPTILASLSMPPLFYRRLRKSHPESFSK